MASTPHKLSQSEILRRLGIPTDPATLRLIKGSSKAQQEINTKAALKGLPHPFDVSTASAIIQDLIPIVAIAGAAALPTDAGTGAASGEAATAAEGGAAGGAASKVASAVTSNAGKIVGSLTVASLFTNTNLWAGIGMTLLGAFLVLFGIIKLSGADPGTVAKRVMPG